MEYLDSTLKMVVQTISDLFHSKEFMNDLFKILFHLSSLKKTLDDGEQLIKDIIAKKPLGDDAKQIFSDLVALVAADLIVIPGVAKEQVTSILDEFQKTFNL